MASDLTIIYLTANEMPERWVQYQLGRLYHAADRFPIISVSRRPMDFGTNLLDTGKRGYWNIYMQMLRAAKLATTKYVGIAEDDCLYTREHFAEYRPADNNVAFDRSRWSVFAWEDDAIFCLRQRVSNCAMIASREYLIDCLEERRARWPDGPTGRAAKWIGEVGRPKVDRFLDVTIRPPAEEWWSTNAIVHLNHGTGTDGGDYGIDAKGRHMIKKHGQLKAIEIPYWGKATNIVKHYRRIDSEALEASSKTESAVVSPQRYAG